jgi:hypothetical protein
LEGAGLSFDCYPLIERLLVSNRNISNPFPYISSFLYFYGIGNNVAGEPVFPIAGGCIGMVNLDPSAARYTTSLCDPGSMLRVYHAFERGLFKMEDKQQLSKKQKTDFDAAAQRAFEYCQACISFNGALQWYNHQLTPFSDHIDGVRKMAYALYKFSSFFMNDIIHLNETKERWQKETRDIKALNMRIAIACRQERIYPRFLLKVPEEPFRYRLGEERKALVEHTRFTVPDEDGDSIPGSPTWLYYQQYLLMEATKKWGMELKALMEQLTRLDAHFAGLYWASSPLLATALTTGYEDRLRVPLARFWRTTEPILSSYIRQFIACAFPKKEKKKDHEEDHGEAHEEGHEEEHEEDHEEEREGTRRVTEAVHRAVQWRAREHREPRDTRWEGCPISNVQFEGCRAWALWRGEPRGRRDPLGSRRQDSQVAWPYSSGEAERARPQQNNTQADCCFPR